ncbi:hypothetical protein HY637_04800 [Candidatus Woesearchaeota archaeon]|nr:hypothetical protein [Candidatus Woesearchaeota archaeon]
MIRIGGHVTHVVKRGKKALQLTSLRGSNVLGLGILSSSSVQVMIALQGSGVENLEKKLGQHLYSKLHGRKFEIRVY